MRRVDSKVKLQYRLSNGLQLKLGCELRVYSKLGAEITQASSTENFITSSLYQQVVMNERFSLGK